MTSRLLKFSLLNATLLFCMVQITFAIGDESKPDLATYEQHVKPLLQKYCLRCHGEKKTQGDMRLDDIDPNIITGEHSGKWEDIHEAFNSGEMPPEDRPQPTQAERFAFARWLDAEFKKARQYGRSNHRGRVRRLTRYELQYALEDLLNVSVSDEVAALPAEAASMKTGLKNSSRLLMISGPHLESYLNVVMAVIEKMKVISAFKPYRVSADIANLNTKPPVTFADKGRKNKPPLAKVQRSGEGVIVQPGGYIDLKIPAVSKWRFRTTFTAKAAGAGRMEVSLGFQRSEVDPRQVVRSLGGIAIAASDELRTYHLDSHADSLPAEFTRALDRPLFVRITNRGTPNLYLESFDYAGNLNTELTSSLIPADIANSKIDAHVRQSIRDFIQKAFRTPPTEPEVDKYYAVYQNHAKEEEKIAALLSAYREILCSPRFFYIGMSGELTGETKQNFELAERLAFFLWCSIPDDQLLKAAAAGELSSRQNVAAQVERMLNDEKSRRLVEQFTDQWLQTSKLFNVAVDSNYYPRFRQSLKELMRRETIEAVNDVVRNGAPATNLLAADHVFINQQLAAFYQIRGVRGDEFRKVEVNEASHRGGLLTQATFLIGNSDGMNSHAILRGVWLAEVILNDPPPDPPKNVPPLDETIPGFEKMTLNQKLVAHRKHGACNSCHQKIDPWGIPFENFDASGAWREKVLVISPSNEKSKRKKKPVSEKSFVEIESASTLPGGTKIAGIDQLKQHLVNHRQHDFAQGLTERLLAYAISRDLDYHDRDFVNQLGDHFKSNNYSVPQLIREIVLSETFQTGNQHGR